MTAVMHCALQTTMPDEQDIFLEVLERRTPEERAEFLNHACRGEPQLRSRIESLLARHADVGSFLERPPESFQATELVGGETNNNGVARLGRKSLSAIDGLLRSIVGLFSPSEKPDSLGIIGQYEVESVLGRGGMGLVLKAYDPSLDRSVAIKVLAPQWAINEQARQRFLREARTAAAVSHPNVVEIFAIEDGQNASDPNGLNTPQATPYFVMEEIRGDTLTRRLLEEGAFDVPEIMEIGVQLANGLAAAHEKGLIHRDIKPSNVLLAEPDGRVKITDFGLARAVGDTGITRDGDVAGTPQYMSPEQAQGNPIDARSDLFSLGSVLYALCTGESPFAGGAPLAVLRRVIDEQPTPIEKLNPQIPGQLREIVDRLLAKQPDDRFATAREVSTALSSLRESICPAAVPQLLAANRQTATSGSSDSLDVSRSLRRWLWVGGLAAAILGVIVIRIRTPDGTEISTTVPSRSKVEIEYQGDSKTATAELVPPTITDPDILALIGRSDRWTWTEAVPLGNGINTETGDAQPHLSPDGLSLWFQSNRLGNETDLFVSRRASTEDPFGPPERLAEPSDSVSYCVSPSLTRDELLLTFSSSEGEETKHMDVWICSRTTVDEQFGKPVNLGPAVNSNGTDLSPSISSDGLSLVFASSGRKAQGRYALFESTRTSRDEPFGEAVNLGDQVNARASDAGPWLSADGRALVFRSTRDTERGQPDLYLTTRVSADEPFHTPIRLGAPFSSDHADGKLTASADWSTVVIASDRPGGSGSTDLWMTRRVPKTE